jgi:pectate lyase
MKKIINIFLLLLISLTGLSQTEDYSTKANGFVNQVVLTVDGGKRYYDTESVDSIDINGSKVTVSQQAGKYTFNNVGGIAFAKAVSELNITEAKGWQESLFVKWALIAGVDNYNVYVKGGNYADFTKIDNQLVRNYGIYGRADAVGLIAGSYDVKVVPVVGENELTDKAAMVQNLRVTNYDRSGYAHFNYTGGVGAYNNDGSLKQGAKVLYVTAKTAKTISTNVVGAEANPCVGIQAIIAAYEKGKDTTPITFRFIGLVSKGDLDAIGSKEEGIQVKGKRADSEMNMTFEGIGDDATITGFGFLVRNCKSIEFRNFGIMRCLDDGLSLDTDNSNIWIHNMDVFYGPKKSGDQVKGDGAIDVKSDSKYVTVSYCHYWDTGKTNMFGMKSESGPNYISYHHNWFDHSDSRHPRIRTMTVHVWNNFYDNVAKYGVGATTGASVFVENNYFLKTKKPILSSLQGTDGLGDGTFSGENGGMIKAYGNYFDRNTPHFSYYTQKNPSAKGYDAYETETRDEQIPASEKTLVGGTSYNNFDTDASLIYAYTPDAAADVPTIIKGYYGAGRMNKGDFTYTFTDNVGSDDTDSAYDNVLGGMLDNYKSTLVGFFGEENTFGDEPGGDEPGGNDKPGGEVTPTPEGTILCTFNKNGEGSNNFFTVSGNGSNSKGSATIDGKEYTECLKMEYATSIKFTLTKSMVMTLYFASTETASIKVDDMKKTSSTNTYTQNLEAGEHELTKADSRNLFGVKLEPIE